MNNETTVFYELARRRSMSNEAKLFEGLLLGRSIGLTATIHKIPREELLEILLKHYENALEADAQARKEPSV
ncbi:hypothetical protein [Vibrio sp. SCSIO 43137]|uniref:hypothetical protein n=1 Tax=Vibrio sp. SCSIO 43137 TaxID=3021011 RepID=UPI002306FB58|nr:hypothetical protein [Vibrio sp. SCSIO 43137]WCE28785.1 hypothetical protein PK654_10475 [Vibrio sp. SCSIO 43137]